MKNIYLVGMMGSGKTSTAKELSALMGVPMIDLDAELEKQEGKRIAEIFQEKGEEWFRERESAILLGQSKQENFIVATGGGVVIRRQNRDLMKTTGEVVFLEASLEQLWARVSKEKGRPLLEDFDPKRKLMSLLTARQPCYDDCAELKVMTDGKTPKQVAEEISKKLHAND